MKLKTEGDKAMNTSIKNMLKTTDFLAPLNSQKEYRLQCATFIALHNMRVRAIEQYGISPSAVPTLSMLLIAPTGCGKSYVTSQIAKASGRKVLTLDCSQLTLSGFKGVNLGSALINLRDECNSEEEFKTCILHLDEFDKIALNEWSSTGNPQPNILKLFDGITQASGSSDKAITIDTSKMSFIFSGCFEGLTDIVKSRLTSSSIGFGSNTVFDTDYEVLKKATMNDVIEMGFMAELCGRINYIHVIPPLEYEDYLTLLSGSHGSMLERYTNLFGTCGVSVGISDKACELIAKRAKDSKLGARTVNPVLYQHFQEALQKIEEDNEINKIILDAKSDELVLRYRRGAKKMIKSIKGTREEHIDVYDVNLTEYMKNSYEINKLCGMCCDLIDLHRPNERILFYNFLNCTFLYLNYCCNPDDRTLGSVKKFAETIKNDGVEKTAFDIMFEDAIQKYTNGDACNEIKEAYYEYKELEDHNTYLAIKNYVWQLRKHWYSSLIEKISE